MSSTTETSETRQLFSSSRDGSSCSNCRRGFHLLDCKKYFFDYLPEIQTSQEILTGSFDKNCLFWPTESHFSTEQCTTLLLWPKLTNCSFICCHTRPIRYTSEPSNNDNLFLGLRKYLSGSNFIQ